MIQRLTWFCLLAVLFPVQAPAQSPDGGATPGTLLKQVTFEQRLGHDIALDVSFRDDSGKTVQLREFFTDRPVVMALVYHRCPMLCNEVLNGLVSSLAATELSAGTDYEAVVISISPTEPPELAASKKRGYLKRIGPDANPAAWHFLTGDEASIRQTAGDVGFAYQLDPKSGEYAHASGIVILTPAGRVSRYFFGIDYPTRDLKFTVMEAAARRVGSLVDQILLLCFHYDPSTGRYSLAVMRGLQAVGSLWVAAIGTYVLVMSRRDRKQRLANGPS